MLSNKLLPTVNTKNHQIEKWKIWKPPIGKKETRNLLYSISRLPTKEILKKGYKEENFHLKRKVITWTQEGKIGKDYEFIESEKK